MARSPFSFFSEVVMRTKSSPLAAKTVATPPLTAENLSTWVKLPLSLGPQSRSSPVASSSVKLGPNSWRKEPKLRWVCLAATSSMACMVSTSELTLSLTQVWTCSLAERLSSVPTTTATTSSTMATAAAPLRDTCRAMELTG